MKDRTDSSQRLEAYWLSRRQEHKIPLRTDFDLLDLTNILPSLTLVELGSDEDKAMSIVLAGSELRDRVGDDITGLDMSDLFQDVSREVLWESIRALFQYSCGLVQYSSTSYRNAPSAIIEITMFPLSGGPDSKDAAIASTVWKNVSLRAATASPVSIESTQDYEWLDCGHGVPDI